MRKLAIVTGVVAGVIALATIAGAGALGSPASGADRKPEASPAIPRPFDPHIDQLSPDSTSQLNVVGRPGIVLPDLGLERAKNGIGGVGGADKD
jgi:hypothetical protein